MKHSMRGGAARPVLLSLGAVALASLFTPVQASAADEGAKSTDVGEIIVTATRRDSAAEKVGVGLTALGREDLKVQAPKTLYDLAGSAPNVFIGQETGGPGQSLIFIRGQGYGDVEKNQATPVGVIVDGVTFGNSTGQLVDMYDVCSVEVDRGPQGLFYGKNTTAGLININRCAPTRKYGGEVELGGGSYGDGFARALINAPLGDKGGIKLSGQWNTDDGYVKNVFTGKQAAGDHGLKFHAVVNYDLTNWLNANVSYDHQRDTGGGDPVQNGNILISQITPGYATTFPKDNPKTGSPDGLGPWQVNNRDGGDYDLYHIDIVSGTLRAKTPIGELFSQTTYMVEGDTVLQDYDGTCAFGIAPPGCTTYGNANYGFTPLEVNRIQHYQEFTQEEHATGSFLNQFDYIVGAFYYQHDIHLNQITDFAIYQFSSEHDTSWAEFGNLDWNPTSTIKLSAGIRNIEETTDFFTYYPGATPMITDHKSWSKAITRFAAQWQATPETLLYFNRSEGFRSGGFSIRGTDSEAAGPSPNQTTNYAPGNNFLAFQPEFDVNYEIGIKNHFFNNSLIFNLDAYINDVTGLQQSEVVLTSTYNFNTTPATLTGSYGPGTNTYIINLPKTEFKGVEMDLTARLGKWFPELTGLAVSANASVQSAQVLNGVVNGAEVPQTTGIFAGQAGANGTTVNLTGTPLQHVPKSNFTIRGTYVHSVAPDAKLTTTLGYSWVSTYALDIYGTTPDNQPSYGLLDASATLDYKNYFLKVSGKNLTDVAYRSFSLPSVAIQGWAPPRTFQVTVGAKF
jgi:iron complex outermembrane receptor protein